MARYLNTADELALKLPQEEIDTRPATLKGMNNVDKRERVSFECNKDTDYSYIHALNFSKAAYYKIASTIVKSITSLVSVMAEGLL